MELVELSIMSCNLVHNLESNEVCSTFALTSFLTD